MASYFTGEIVGVKRKAPEVITMVNGYPHATYPAFDIVGKILWRNLSKDKYEVKVNNSNCILRVSDCDIFKIDYAGESEIFDSILLNDSLSQPYIYLGEFADLADHVLNKKRKAFGFGGFTQLFKKELKYAEADVKTAKEVMNTMFGVPKYEYKKIIFSGPCTIILWTDGSKTIAKTSDGEVFDPEKGVAICFMKKMIGHTEANKILRKASKDFYDEIAREVNRQFDDELRKARFPLPKGVTFRPFIFFDEPIDNNAVVHIDEAKKVEDK